jgi:hypothetical protein
VPTRLRVRGSASIRAVKCGTFAPMGMKQVLRATAAAACALA